MIQDIDSLSVAGVYTIIHVASGKTYVGEALNIRTRWSGHFSCLQKGNHNNYYLQRSWNKYGAEAFEFKIFLILERLENESNYMLKKRLKREENKVLKLFPKNFNLEIPSEEHDYLIPGPMAKERMKESATSERNTASGKARMRRIRIEAMEDPTSVRLHKLATKAAWQKPEIKASRVAAFNTPEGKENRAAAAKTGWLKRKEHQKDPEFMAKEQERAKKAGASIKKTFATPEMREKMSQTSTQSWKVSGRKEKVSKSLKAFYSDPTNRKKHSENMKKAYSKKPETP